MSQHAQKSSADSQNTRASESAVGQLAALIRTWGRPGTFGRVTIELVIHDGAITEIVESTTRKTRP